MANPLCRVLGHFCFVVIGTLVTPFPSAAQVVPGRVSVPGESRATANRLAATAKLLADKQWSEAIDEYLQIQEESGDDLVPLDSRHSVSARRLCQKQLAALPPEALRLYRDRVESQAKKWLEQGKSERDPHWLLRLVDESFCSRHTDRALDLLGDLAFERGRFEEAESWWNMLAPRKQVAEAPGDDHNPQPLKLVYPDPQVDLKRVQAKQLLVQLFTGNHDHWADDLKAFRASNGDAQGELAGQTGKYANILEAISKRPELHEIIHDRQKQPRPWSTFAGNASHNFIAPQAPKRFTYESPPWPIRLNGQPAGKDLTAEKARSGKFSFSEPQPKCHPVVVGDMVFISDSRTVAAYDVLTAQRIGFFDLQSIKKFSDGAKTVGRDYTVTVVDNRVYAVLGNPESVLVCLDLSSTSNGQLHLRWHCLASESEGGETPAFWEGAPIANDHQVFIARTRSDKHPGVTFVDCFDGDTGQIRWRREICLAPDDSNLGGLNRSHLLTLAGPNLVYCSDAGVIVALDAASGRRVWACRYSSRGLKTNNGDSSPRGLSSTMYHSGRVFVAPADYDGILCLDAGTGEKLWERKPIEVIHLLGVAKGKLILTTAKTDHWPAGIRALEAETGADIRRWIQPADATNLYSYGRGFLAGDWVFWPTVVKDGSRTEELLTILNQEDGQQLDLDPTQYRQVRSGNTALGNGCLAVADDEYLYVYVPPARLLEQRENQAKNSDDATASYRVAVARTDAGQPIKALEAFARAARLARPNDKWGNKSLLEQVRMDWHKLLLSLADQATRTNNLNAADAYFKQAASPEFATIDRLRALVHQAESSSSTDPHRAKAIYESILQDDALSRGWLIEPDGTRHQARWWAAGKIDRLTGFDNHRLRPGKSSVSSQDYPPIPLPTSISGITADHNHIDSADSGSDWKLPLAPSWEIPLDRGETFLGVSHSSDSLLFTCRGQEVVCRKSMTNKPRWIRRLTDTPTWLASHGDAVLLAGPREISSLSMTDGEVRWDLSAPPMTAPRDEEEIVLHDFRLVGSVLIFLQGHRHLFGVDVQTGRVLWQRQAPNASLRLPSPAGRFFPNFYAGENGILVQTSGGRLWIINPFTGELTFEGPTSRTPWPRPPVPIDKNSVAIIPDLQHVMLLSLPTAKILWRKKVGQPSISAESPQLLWNGKALFQLLDGWQLARLDFANGDSIFEKALCNEPIKADRAALDSDSLYFVNRGVLQARSLPDGRLLWEQRLRRLAVPWRVVGSPNYLFLFPSQPPFTLRFGFFLNPQPMSFPLEMQWDDMPLVICDKRTGKIVQQMNFHGTNSHAGFHFSKPALMVVLGEKILAFQPAGVR
jgi:outer membrane protein assembly factor BamB